MTELRPSRRQSEISTYYLCTEKYFPPNHLQVSSAVKGRDVLHDQRKKRRTFRTREVIYGLLVLAILIAAFGSLFIIAAAIKG